MSLRVVFRRAARDELEASFFLLQATASPTIAAIATQPTIMILRFFCSDFICSFLLT